MPSAHEVQRGDVERMVEIRSYNLKPGTRDRFHQLFLKEALPMLQSLEGRCRRLRAIAARQGFVFPDARIRRRRTTAEGQRTRSTAAQEWIKGPRERVLADIDSYTTIVVHLDERRCRVSTGCRHRRQVREQAHNQWQTISRS